MNTVGGPEEQALTEGDSASEMARRLERINAQLWVAYPEAKDAFGIMNRLFDAPDQTRPESFALIGDPSFGKSYLLKQFVASKMEGEDLNKDEDPEVPLVKIQMTESPEPAAMLREILARLGAPFSVRLPVDELMRKIVVLAESLRIRVFVIDEFHMGFQGTHRQQMIMLNIARGLTNRTKRPLIVAGTDDIDSFLRNDTQLNERFIRRHLRRWKEDADTQRLLKGFEQQLALRNPSKLASPEMTAHILQLTGGNLGRISRLLVFAAEAAIKSGDECIDKDLLSEMAKQLPGDPYVGI